MAQQSASSPHHIVSQNREMKHTYSIFYKPATNNRKKNITKVLKKLLHVTPVSRPCQKIENLPFLSREHTVEVWQGSLSPAASGQDTYKTNHLRTCT